MGVGLITGAPYGQPWQERTLADTTDSRAVERRAPQSVERLVQAQTSRRLFDTVELSHTKRVLTSLAGALTNSPGTQRTPDTNHRRGSTGEPRSSALTKLPNGCHFRWGTVGGWGSTRLL